jgi:hypothetical protein
MPEMSDLVDWNQVNWHNMDAECNSGGGDLVRRQSIQMTF